MPTPLLALVLLLSTLAAPVLGAGRALPAEAPVAPVAQAYSLDVAFDPAAATIAGEMTVVWTNTTGEPQTALPFRLYPNAEHYGAAEIALHRVLVEEVPVEAEMADADQTVAAVGFPAPVAPGDSRQVEIAFTTAIPIDSTGSFGIFRGTSTDGAWSLVNWYPIVAGWDPATGWYLEAPDVGVDPTLVTASRWRARVSHPADLTLVATGAERATVSGETATTEIELDIGRELAMVAVPTAEVVTTSTDAGGTEVAVTLAREAAIPGMADVLLEVASEGIEHYTAWLGTPLGDELDLVTTTLDGALGVSWTGAIWLDLGQLAADGTLDAAERESLRFVLLHEVAHQWIANLIGANSNDHTWLTEGLAGVLAVAVIRETDGGAAAERAFRGGVVGPYRAWVNGGGDAVAASPLGELDSLEHSFVSYGKGGAGFAAIRQEIGDAAFFAALRSLATERAWEIVTPAELLAAFEAASGAELEPLWHFWFFAADTTLADVDAVIAGEARAG